MSLIATARRWRLAALLAALAFTAATLSPALTPPAHAHTGTPGTLCGSVDIPPTAVYQWQYTNGDGSHYHTWLFPGNQLHDEFCGYF